MVFIWCWNLEHKNGLHHIKEIITADKLQSIGSYGKLQEGNKLRKSYTKKKKMGVTCQNHKSSETIKWTQIKIRSNDTACYITHAIKKTLLSNPWIKRYTTFTGRWRHKPTVSHIWAYSAVAHNTCINFLEHKFII